MKIQYRIALIFALLTISIVFIVSTTAYYFANQDTFEDFYKRLEIRAIVAAKTSFEKNAMNGKAYEEIRRLHLEKLPYEQEYILKASTLVDDIQKNDLQLSDMFYKTALTRGEARERKQNIFSLGYRYTTGSDTYIIIVSARNDFIESYLNELKRITVIGIIFTMIFSTLIGLFFSKLVLKPIRDITQKMQDISGSQLHHRLDIQGKSNDEIGMLSATFNNMLDRLEATFETQKNFISNASHELNTPLTAIIGESEYMLDKPRNTEQYVEALRVILNESERLKKITGSLLHLAQTGYSDKKLEFVDLRIDEIIYTVKETVDNIIPDNKVFIDLSLMPEEQDKLLIKGNAQLLELALANIVLNGCKYSDNKPVRVAIAAADHKVIIIIEDKGIGIPAAEIAYIYEPFFRASNTGKYQGYGIGLPLSRNIIRIHSGELDVTSIENSGTRIKITIPSSSVGLI